MEKFTWFRNENGDYSICYAWSTGYEKIVGFQRSERQATASCKALNVIMKEAMIDEHRNDIYQLETNLLDVPHTKEEKAFARCEIKNHKMRVSEIRKL